MTIEKKTKELDLINLASRVLKEWKFLTRFAVAGGIIGLVVAFSTPKYFKSEVVLAPEFSSGSIGLSDNLADLASSFGVDLGGSKSMDAIYPDLYPDIFSSTDFITSLYEVPVHTQKDSVNRTYHDHLIKDFKMPFWDYPKVWLDQLIHPIKAGKRGASDSYSISRRQWTEIKLLQQLITCNVDKKTSVISICVIDQDQLVAAIMADTLQQRLQGYITKYRTNKARIDVEHYRKLTEQARVRYEEARENYATFSDANQEAVLTAISSKTEDLENEMQLRFNVYSQCTAQLKAAESKLQQRTPAFSMIQRPVTNPKSVSTPKIVILFVWVVLFCVVGSLWVLWGRMLWSKMRKKES